VLTARSAARSASAASAASSLCSSLGRVRVCCCSHKKIFDAGDDRNGAGGNKQKRHGAQNVAKSAAGPHAHRLLVFSPGRSAGDWGCQHAILPGGALMSVERDIAEFTRGWSIAGHGPQRRSPLGAQGSHSFQAFSARVQPRPQKRHAGQLVSALPAALCAPQRGLVGVRVTMAGIAARAFGPFTVFL